MRGCMTPRGRAGGFTLLEVMAALLIFLTGIVGVLALFAGGLALHRGATQRAMVANLSGLVQERVERLLAEGAAAGPGEELAPVREVPIEEYPGYFYAIEKMESDPETGTEGGVLATVRVYTVDAGRKKGESFLLFVRPRADPQALIRRARAGGPAPRPEPETTEETGG
ncbi:MAG: hypothetical protein HY812_00860 [Planctomycetes bacterium]|nr:hypothetical protein [Planctomycetota bacterium]